MSPPGCDAQVFPAISLILSLTPGTRAWILSLCHTTDYEVSMVMGQNPGTYSIIYNNNSNNNDDNHNNSDNNNNNDNPKIAGVAGC